MDKSCERHFDYGCDASQLIADAIHAGWDSYDVARGLPARYLEYVDACAFA